jgi:hypothetical protein
MKRKNSNPLLNEYLDQVNNSLTVFEKKQYESYSFYDVYEVTIGGYSSGPGCCEVCTACGCIICLCNICIYS